jgi:hypothetical protein
MEGSSLAADWSSSLPREEDLCLAPNPIVLFKLSLELDLLRPWTSPSLVLEFLLSKVGPFEAVRFKGVPSSVDVPGLAEALPPGVVV